VSRENKANFCRLLEGFWAKGDLNEVIRPSYKYFNDNTYIQHSSITSDMAC